MWRVLIHIALRGGLRINNFDAIGSVQAVAGSGIQVLTSGLKYAGLAAEYPIMVDAKIGGAATLSIGQTAWTPYSAGVDYL